MVESPYDGLPESKWSEKTKDLIEKFPLDPELLVNTVLESWNDIFEIKIGKEEVVIGRDIFPKPQIIGFFLHELIPLKISNYDKNWSVDNDVSEKDLVYLPNNYYSVEIKTSSNPKKIFGNRSYAQETQTDKKDKSGYYLAINFEKIDGRNKPKIVMIRFGWLDHSDWIGQKAQSGQQSHLPPSVEKNKLMVLYAFGHTNI